MKSKEIIFWGDSLKVIRAFPDEARNEIGTRLREVQEGGTPHDSRGMNIIASGVREIRVSVDQNQFRTVYVAKFSEAVYVLHAFQKKTQKTPHKDIELASKRFKQILSYRSNE